jgi:VanZ family protein
MGKMLFIGFFKCFYKSLIWALVILFLCLLPSDKVNRLIFIRFVHFDIIVHFIFYFILEAILYIDISRYLKEQGKIYLIALLIVLILLLWGIMIELMQHYIVASRMGTASDVASNLCGTIVSLGIIIIIARKYYIKSG